VLLAAGCPSNLAYHRLTRAANEGKIRTTPTGMHSRAYHADDVTTFADKYR
jgi:hypothetical protein